MKKWALILTFLTVSVSVIVLFQLRRSFISSPISPVTLEQAKLIAELPGSAVLHIPLITDTSVTRRLASLYRKQIADATPAVRTDQRISRYICSPAAAPSRQWNYTSEEYKKTLDLLQVGDIRTIVVVKPSLHAAVLSDPCRDISYWWYSMVPEQLTIEEDTRGDIQQSLVLSDQLRLKARLFFAKSGKFFLNGFVLYPNVLTDTVVTLPDRTQLNYSWEPIADGGIRTPEGLPPAALDVVAGQSADIVSSVPVTESLYVTVFFRFEPDSATQSAARPVIEKRYSTNQIDVYQVN